MVERGDMGERCTSPPPPLLHISAKSKVALCERETVVVVTYTTITPVVG